MPVGRNDHPAMFLGRREGGHTGGSIRGVPPGYPKPLVWVLGVSIPL